MTLKLKLMIGIIAALTVSSALTTATSWYFAHDGMGIIGTAATSSLGERARDQLTSIRSAKALHVEDLFKRICNQAQTLAEGLTVREAAQTLGAAYFTLQGETSGALDYKGTRAKLLADYVGPDYLANPAFAANARLARGYAPRPAERYLPPDANGVLLQGMYVLSSGNPNPIGEKHRLDANPVNATYNTLHRKYHPILRNYLTTFGYYDIFIIDAVTGTVVYTVFKEKDFATSLITGPYRDTGLGAVFREAAEAGRKGLRGTVAMSDFTPYEPSYNAPAAFTAVPIYDATGAFTAVLAFQLPVDNINRIMTSDGKWRDVGLGATGETYLVGPDMRARSSLRGEDTKGNTEPLVDTVAARKGLAGESGADTITDYRGKKVLAAWQPLNIQGLHYALIAEIDEAEALAAAKTIEKTRSMAEGRMLGSVLAVLVLAALLGTGLSMALVGALSRPLRRLQDYAGDVAEGHLDARPEGTYPAELDAMRLSIERMVQNLRLRITEADAKGHEAAASARTAQTALDKARESERRIKGLMERMTGAAGKARSVSEHVSRSINELTSQVVAITGGVETQRNRMDETAHAMENMRAMVSDVADNARRAAEQADLSRGNAEKGAAGVREAVGSIGTVRERVAHLNSAMTRLGEEADNIGKVMSVISDIADQTNLLALNAAIEAARAGEAGRGFAVVADEVRKLAEKTMTATGEVGEAVNRIQTHTRENLAAVQAAMREATVSADAAENSGRVMDDIVALVDETAGMVQSIAAASDQQAAASTTVGRNVEDVSTIAGSTAASMSHFAGTLEDIFAQVQELFSMIEVISTGEEGVSVLADSEQGDMLVRWSDELSNLPSIDVQHKRLIDLINTLYRATRTRDMDEARRVFASLRDYAVEHFGYEEKLFVLHDYPEGARHKEIHRRFVETVLKWEKQLEAGDPDVAMTTLRGLVDWLVTHIMKEDRKYEAHMRERGVE